MIFPGGGILNLMQAKSFPTVLAVWIVVLAIINGLATAYYWYWSMPWFDMPMHFFGGILAAGCALWWLYSRKGHSFPKFLPLLMICIFAALSVGLLWEIFEGVVSFNSTGHINEMTDTMSDLFFDSLGGVMVARFYIGKRKT